MQVIRSALLSPIFVVIVTMPSHQAYADELAVAYTGDHSRWQWARRANRSEAEAAAKLICNDQQSGCYSKVVSHGCLLLFRTLAGRYRVVGGETLSLAFEAAKTARPRLRSKTRLVMGACTRGVVITDEEIYIVSRQRRPDAFRYLWEGIPLPERKELLSCLKRVAANIVSARMRSRPSFVPPSAYTGADLYALWAQSLVQFEGQGDRRNWSETLLNKVPRVDRINIPVPFVCRSSGSSA